MRFADFEDGPIGVLGLGREGRAAREYLRRRHPGIQLTLLAESPPEDDIKALLTPEDELAIGPFAEAGLERFGLLVRSPGISPYRASLQRALEAGVRLTTPSSIWFADHPEANTVCITGTKGKSTTSALLAHMLRFCGRRVRLAGNIGTPLLACDDRDVDWWVIELSSYQLVDLEADPTVSMILNLTPEHLDWHGGERAYQRDKLRLVELAGDRLLIANAADQRLRSALEGRGGITWFNGPDGIRVAGESLYDGDRALQADIPDGLPGRHNLANIAAALTALGSVGEDVESGISALPSFRCLPHRLQLLGQRDGLRYVNDSISSTPVATAAALESYAGQPVTLIVGGLDRGLDWAPYAGAFRKNTPVAVIGVPSNGAAILRTLEREGVTPPAGLHRCEDLAGAVSLAGRLTPNGGVVLLSPGAPSFPQFRDFRARGTHFADLCGFPLEDWEII
jgi:UDP-N-acetylmuramoylalanine--D-glutamate ligase